MRTNGKLFKSISVRVVGVLLLSLGTGLQCSPTTVLVISDTGNNRIVIAADSLVRRRYRPAESRCKIHVVTDDCTMTMVGMYKLQDPPFDLLALGKAACMSGGDLKQRADRFLTMAFPQLTEILPSLGKTDPAYLKQLNDGKPLVELFFIGAYRQQPAVFARGVILESGILKPEAIEVPSERLHLFAGVNGHIRTYIRTHSDWDREGDISAARRLLELEVDAHPDIVGLPASIGTVDSRGRFHWLEPGKCRDER
jgi:hypothetical protein